MKKFLAILVLSLFLITPSQSAGIRDFQIEGISIGDSLLDYYSIESQKEMSQAYDKKNKFTSVIISDPAFQTYNQIQVTHTGKKQEILAIAQIFYEVNNRVDQKLVLINVFLTFCIHQTFLILQE